MAKEDRGFASMDRAKQREIASKGGKAAHQKGTAHEWTSEEARDAGRKGGIASHQRRREQSAPPVESAVAMDRSSGSGSSWGSSSDSSSSYSSGSSSSSSSRDSYGSERGSSSEPSMPSSEREE
jgi:general stress protein YciG